MTCIRENNDGKTRQCSQWTLPGEIVDLSTIHEGVALDKVKKNECDEVANRTKSDYRCVLERI